MEEFPISSEFLLSIDSVLCMGSGAVVGLLVAMYMKGWGFGLVGNIVTGLVGGLVGGVLVNWLDFMNVGDYADPMIAGAVGAVVFLGIAGLLKKGL